MSSAVRMNWNRRSHVERLQAGVDQLAAAAGADRLGDSGPLQASSNSSRPGIGARRSPKRPMNSRFDSAANSCHVSLRLQWRIIASKVGCGCRPIIASFSSAVNACPRRRSISVPTAVYTSSVLNIRPSMSKTTARMRLMIDDCDC